MARTTIAELDINVDAMIKSVAEVKQKLDEVAQSQKELVKAGDTSSKQFVQNAIDMKLLNAEYGAGVKAISENTKATVEATNRQEMMTLALNTEVKSIDEARASNKELNKLRNSANASTKEGQEEILRLNEALDKNNEFVKENADAYLKQKINIGNYSDSMKEALNSMNPLNGGLLAFIGWSKEAGGVMPLLSNGLKAVTASVYGMIKSTLTFLATPIGAVIGAIGLVLGVLVKYLTSTQEGMDKITAVTRPVMAIFESLIGVVQKLGKIMFDAFSNPKQVLLDLVDFIKNNIINRVTAIAVIFEGLANLDFSKVTNGILQAGTGVENLTGKIANAGKETEKFFNDAIAKGKEIDRLTKGIEDSEASLNKERAITSAKVLELELISKNTALNTAERVKAQNEIVKLKTEEGEVEARILENKIKLLVVEQSLNDTDRKGNKELQDLEAELIAVNQKGNEAKKEGIRVTSTLQKEAIAKQKADEKARADAQKKAIQDGIKQQEDALKLFEARENVKAKTLEEQIKTAKYVSDEEIKILDKQLKAGNITKTQYDLAYFNSKQKIANLQTQLIVQQVETELDIFIENNKSKLDANTIYTDEIVAQELERIRLVQEAEKKAQEVKLTQGVINQKEYDDSINAIKLEAGEQEKEVNKTKAQSDRDAKMSQMQADREIALENSETTYQEDLLIIQNRKEDEDKKNQEDLDTLAITQEQYDAKKKQTQERADKDRELAGLNRTQGQLNEFKKLGEGLEGLFGKNKAISSAMAGINTALAVTEILKTPSMFPSPYAQIVKGVEISVAVATGMKSIAQINGAKFAGGGLIEINGNSHDMGGVPIYAGNQYVGEAQGNEGIGIMNRGAFDKFKEFNYRFGDGDVSRGGLMAGGGIITQGIPSQSNGISTDDLLNVIKSVPAPVVMVEDILQGTTNNVGVKSKANFE